MRRRFLTYSAAILLAAGFAYGALRLFGIQFAIGEVYPEYSSLRSDPLGSKLLFDSLQGLPGIRVERNYLPPEYLPEHGATILFLGSSLAAPAVDLKQLERAASRGNRIVVALRLTKSPQPAEVKNLQDAWHIKLDEDPAKGRAHRFFFGDAPGWKILDRAGPKLLAIEKDFGKGTVALLAESSDFDNESTIAGDRMAQVTAAIGPYSTIVFDEQHLGIAEGGSVVDLARRFRLGGLMFGLALVAALFLWKNAAGFPPPARTPTSGMLAGRTSQAGLLTLLQRHVPPRDLAAACWQEWLIGNGGQVSAARIERAAAIARRGVTDPLESTREIAAVLHGKGEL